MMTMKEACKYVKNSRLARAKEHRNKFKSDGLCNGLTDKEYNRIRIPMKKAGSKGRSFSHTKLWETQKYSNNIHTIYHDGTFTK